MGIYADYLDLQLSFPALTAERKTQLSRIATIRQRDVLVYAADLRKGDAPIAILYEDLLPFTDQLSNLHGTAVDVILETPGGYAEIAEDMVRLLRGKYSEVAFVVPGSAKSAGTIMVMSGDEILLEPGSSLGPIDAQLSWQNRSFSADAFLKGLENRVCDVVIIVSSDELHGDPCQLSSVELAVQRECPISRESGQQHHGSACQRSRDIGGIDSQDLVVVQAVLAGTSSGQKVHRVADY